MSVELTMSQIEEQLVAKATAERQADALDYIQTSVGSAEFLQTRDSSRLNTIIEDIEKITDKKLFKGFMFNSNVEQIVAIAGAIQYAKGPIRDNFSPAIIGIFTEDVRTQLLEAYGALPYFAEETFIELNGETVSVDPDKPVRAGEGRRTNVAVLEPVVNSVARKLGLLNRYEVTEEQASIAWRQAKGKLSSLQAFSAYKVGM